MLKKILLGLGLVTIGAAIYQIKKEQEFNENINDIRKAAGKDPIEMNEKLKTFLGEDSKSKSMKESLDNIAENIKKDPKLKKRVLDILHE